MTTQELNIGGGNASLSTTSLEGLVRLLEPDELTPAQQLEAELEYLKDDRIGSAHLTPLLTDHLVKGDFDQDTQDIVASHLQVCPWCTSMLREALQLCAVPADHPAFTLLRKHVKQRPTEENEAHTTAWETVGNDAEAAEAALAFEGWVEHVADGMATLRLVDREGRRSTATYAVADLQREYITAEAGTAFRCQVTREQGGFHVTFQPVPRRRVSEGHRRQLEDKMMAAYSTLANDY